MDTKKNNDSTSCKGGNAVFIILGCVFAIIFALFALPILGYVLNIGNILGMLFSSIMMFLCFGHKLVSKAVSAIWVSIPGKLLVCAILVILAAGIVWAVFLTSLIAKADAAKPAEDATVIVLGCQVRGDHPSLMLRQRINAAADYLEAHPGAVCIVSGGKGDDEKISEAQCMYDELTAKGIEPGRIIMEERSTNTAENIAYSKEIIEREGLNEKTAIVTDVFHEYRASLIAKDAGLECGSVPAPVSWYLFPTFYVRELVAITAVFLGLA